jgi:hypothetical protein
MNTKPTFRLPGKSLSDKPATEAQKDALLLLGGQVTEGLTIREASESIFKLRIKSITKSRNKEE